MAVRYNTSSNPYYSAVDQTLEEYIPLPFQEMVQAGQAIQQRYDQAEAMNIGTDTMLSSIEALAPAQREYVNNYVGQYRQSASQLYDKYNGNISDPNYIRESRRLNTKFANDPNLKTIKATNEALLANRDIENKLAAQGQLYVRPQFTGTDQQGRLTSNVGQIRAVNTLGDWANRLKMAASTTTEVGNTITNRPSLEQASSEIMSAIQSGAPEVRDLIQAYQTQGMSPEQAAAQVAADAQRLSGQYAVSEETNWNRMNYNLRASELAETRAARQAKAAASAQSSGVPAGGTYFVPGITPKPDGSGVIAERDVVDNLEIPLAGKSNVNFNTPFQGVLSGERFVMKGGRFNNVNEKKQGSTTLKDGTFVNVSVPFVITSVENGSESQKKQRGNILSKDTGFFTAFGSDGSSDNLDIQTDNKGQFVYLDKDRKAKAYIQPQAFGVYKDNESDATIYKKLNRDETLTYLGPQAGKLSNDSMYSQNVFSNLDSNTQMQVLQGIQSKGYDIKSLTPSQINDLTNQFIDESYYMQRKAPLFSNPGTSKPLINRYGITE